MYVSHSHLLVVLICAYKVLSHVYVIEERTHAAVPFYNSQYNSASVGVDVTSVFNLRIVKVVGQYEPSEWNDQLPIINDRYKLDKLHPIITDDRGSEKTEKTVVEYLRTVLTNSNEFQGVLLDPQEPSTSQESNNSSEESNNLLVYKSDSTIYSLKEMHPFLTGSDARPDAFVEIILKHADDYDVQIPILIAEVFSNTYDHTLAKLAFLLMNQLRLFRHIDTSINRCSGFVFPRQKEETFVTKVNVIWGEKFCFEFELAALKEDEVENAIKTVAIENFRNIKDCTVPSIRYCMRLSQSDLGKFGTDSVQVPSLNNVIVCNQSYYFKIYFSNKDMGRVSQLYLSLRCNPEVVNQIIFPYRDTLPSLPDSRPLMLVYKRLRYPPLTRRKAKCCLKHLIPKVHDALVQLHTHLRVAHLDVRLENICFNENCLPILIDLDRNAPLDENGKYLSKMFPGSAMYTRPEDLQTNWTVEHSDY